MQKLWERNTYTPLNASQVQCNCDPVLNKEDTLSVQGLKTSDNNPDVNLSQNTGSLNSKFVFVLSIEGKPLMPCKPAKCKKLLKSGKAKVVKRFPFTIQLNFECENKVQKINLGIDTGFGNIGFSATTEKKELICGTVILDNKTKDRLDEKRMYRRGRRNKLWYRKARFNNRKRKEGWLPTSVERRYQSHLILIEKLKKILPITNTIIEIAKFDIQKIENPDIEGTQYQQGNLYQYQNIRSYLMCRGKGKCQLCGKDFKNQSAHIHHIKPRSKGGNNRVNNLAILHEKCHDKLHRKHLELKTNSKNYKPSTFMDIINKKFYKDVPDLKVTYGNITFVNRNSLNLVKTHYNDAFVISGGSNQDRVKPIEIKQVHRNNRVLQLNRKGFKPSIKKEKSKVNPEDLFWVKTKQYVCKGMFNLGKYILYGSMKKKEYFKFTDITKIFKFGSFAWKTV
ncbi:MAG: HNH endonuclease [Desulfobacterales bacterium]|nr:HNH endonuclease [Desulfobacterales bacterium]